MKTFEEIVDRCFKPRKPDKLYLPHRTICSDEAFSKTKDFIDVLYGYSECLSKLHYGKDINEPVIKICERILNKPERLHLVDTKIKYSKDYDGWVFVERAYISKFVVQDKDTNQKFVVENGTLKIPTCLTDDENRLLAATLREWNDHMKASEEDKKLKREQKRKDKFRQELTDLYKGL